jgi:hypothetical protein
MVDEDSRYVKKLILLVSIGITILFSIFVIMYARSYTDKAIKDSVKTERIITKAYVDSIFDDKFIPKLETIMNQQDTIIDQNNVIIKMLNK